MPVTATAAVLMRSAVAVKFASFRGFAFPDSEARTSDASEFTLARNNSDH